MAEWQKTKGSNIPEGALRAGYEADGRPLFIARRKMEGIKTTGKAGLHLQGGHIPYGCKENVVTSYKVLVLPAASNGFYEWKADSNGSVPPNAVATDDDLYIGRVETNGSLIPGKVSVSHKCAYYALNGQELSSPNYEVLCKIK